MDLPDGCSREMGASLDRSLNAPISPSKAGRFIHRDRLSDPERLRTDVSFQSLVNFGHAYFFFFFADRCDFFFAAGFLFCTMNTLPAAKLALCFSPARSTVSSARTALEKAR